MSRVFALAVLRAANTAVEYIPGEGALCPVCLLLHQRNRGRVSRTDGDIRYCVCPLCSISFKAVEKAIPAIDVVEPRQHVRKSPENIDAKPKKRQSKNRKG